MESVFDTYMSSEGTSAEPEDIPKTNDPVFVLGKKYSALQELELIRRDVQSRLWCTYRRGFVPIGEPQYTTDRGWGCMLRCGQMLLAEALINLHLSRDWFWSPETRDPTYLKIVNRFEDNRKNPFSVHTIALMGDSEDKKVGEWFGPNTVSQVLKKLVQYDDWCSISIHVALNNLVILDEIINLCEEGENEEDLSWKPLLLIIPIRVGLSEVNPIYIDSLKRCFELPGIVGIIGGRPNQALYFIGYVGDEALYLDPHTTQKHGTVGKKSTEDEMEMDKTFHQKYAGRLGFKQMDPSLALAYLCKTKNEFNELLKCFQEDIANPSKQPLFEIAKSACSIYQPRKASSQDLNVHDLNVTAAGASFQDFVEVEEVRKNESDEEFEFIE